MNRKLFANSISTDNTERLFVFSQLCQAKIFYKAKTANTVYSKTCLKRPLKKEDQKLFFNTDYRLMQVTSISECSKRAFCNTLTFIKLLFVFKTFVLSIFEWPLKTSFTV